MLCPVCSSNETKVVDSRNNKNNMTIRRRRECSECSFRFSTQEEIELLGIRVKKNNGETEKYDRRKLKTGIERSLTKRPYEKDDLDHLIRKIEQDIQKEKSDVVESKEIGKIVMRNLKDFDKVAYIRFASIYREFEDLDKFENEIRLLD